MYLLGEESARGEGWMRCKPKLHTGSAPRDPKLIASVDADARANLVLPLSWHHLGVGTRDVEAGEEAGLVVGLGDRASERPVCTCNVEQRSQAV